MHWVLQENLFDENGFRDAIEVLERFNIPYSLHKVIPFVGELEPDIDPDGPVICMGSYSMRHVAKKKGWYPGVFDLEPVNFTVQKHYWGDRLLNHDAIVCKFSEAKIEDYAFLRPIEDSKVFAGRMFSKDELEEWQYNVLNMGYDYGSTLNADTLIQVCPHKNIYSEYRYWIVKNKIVTKSMYKRGGKVFYSDVVDGRFDEYVKSVLDYCTEINWFPHDAYCLDVCDTDDGIKIVEIGTVNACGFYSANMQLLILSIENAFNR